MQIFQNLWITICCGRGYTVSDTTNEVVINETLVKKLGLKSPKMQLAKISIGWSGNLETIVGVVRDFKPNS
jgi:hypothetical protein